MLFKSFAQGGERFSRNEILDRGHFCLRWLWLVGQNFLQDECAPFDGLGA